MRWQQRNKGVVFIFVGLDGSDCFAEKADAKDLIKVGISEGKSGVVWNGMASAFWVSNWQDDGGKYKTILLWANLVLWVLKASV